MFQFQFPISYGDPFLLTDSPNGVMNGKMGSKAEKRGRKDHKSGLSNGHSTNGHTNGHAQTAHNPWATKGGRVGPVGRGGGEI